jgi:uncharacterized membrane protein YgdD (TMEM256/DUF423 family)
MDGARPWLVVAAINGLIAVAAGAYGWHSLEVADSGLRDIFLTGVDYQMWHALALLGVAWLAARRPDSRAVRVAGGAFVAGIVLFSGSLYATAMTGAVPLPGAAPAGGFCLIGGWAALAWAGWRA